MKIGIYNEAGELVEEIYSQRLPQPLENVDLGGGGPITSLHGAQGAVTVYYGGVPIAVWDGFASGGNPATNGTYYVKVDNVDNAGVVKSVTQQVMVNRNLFRSTILIYNEAGEVVRHLYALVDDPGSSPLLGAQLSTGLIQPGGGAGAPSQVAIILSNGTTVIWDGKADSGSFVQNGQYLIEIHSADGKGGEATVNQSIAVLNAARDMSHSILCLPNLLDASNNWSAIFQDNADPGATLTVRLYTLAGELVREIPGGAGTAQLSWDAQGLASGVYLAVVEARGADGGLVNRQVLKVLVLR